MPALLEPDEEKLMPKDMHANRYLKLSQTIANCLLFYQLLVLIFFFVFHLSANVALSK